MLFIGSVLQLQHLLFKPGVSCSIGKALDSRLVLKPATLQVSRLEEHLLDIGRNLTLEAAWSVLNMTLAGLESSTSLVVSCCNRASKSSNFDLISTDAIPTAREELASSPSSSEISIAKENRLSEESCS